jgi:hypothetical protein
MKRNNYKFKKKMKILMKIRQIIMKITIYNKNKIKRIILRKINFKSKKRIKVHYMKFSIDWLIKIIIQNS